MGISVRWIHTKAEFYDSVLDAYVGIHQELRTVELEQDPNDLAYYLQCVPDNWDQCGA